VPGALIPPAVQRNPPSVTLYYLNPGPVASTIAAFKAALDATVSVSWANALSVAALAPKIIIKDLSDYYNPDNIFLPAVNAAWAGAVAGDCLPYQAAANAEKVTAQSGKINRGQIFIPYVPESGNVQGILTGGQQALYQILLANLATTFAAGGHNFVPQMFSPSLSNLVIGTTGIYMMPLVNLDLDEVVTGLKRRKPKAVYV
jgi:hypothetical protein